jgi:hypothetical protein
MNYKIEANVQLPTGKRAKYPFGKLEIGESVIIDNEYTRAKHSKYNSAANNYGKPHGKKFKVRKTENNEIRVWRTQ